MFNWFLNICWYNEKEKQVNRYLDDMIKEHENNVFLVRNDKIYNIEKRYYNKIMNYSKMEDTVFYNVECKICHKIINNDNVLYHTKKCLCNKDIIMEELLHMFDDMKLQEKN